MSQFPPYKDNNFTKSDKLEPAKLLYKKLTAQAYSEDLIELLHSALTDSEYLSSLRKEINRLLSQSSIARDEDDITDYLRFSTAVVGYLESKHINYRYLVEHLDIQPHYIINAFHALQYAPVKVALRDSIPSYAHMEDYFISANLDKAAEDGLHSLLRVAKFNAQKARKNYFSLQDERKRRFARDAYDSHVKKSLEGLPDPEFGHKPMTKYSYLAYVVGTLVFMLLGLAIGAIFL